MSYTITNQQEVQLLLIWICEFDTEGILFFYIYPFDILQVLTSINSNYAPKGLTMF